MKAMVWSLCSVLFVGCASKLEAKGGASQDEADLMHSGKFSSKMLADDVTETLVDASSDTEWQFFDLDSGKSASEDEGWDLEFSRFRVLSNGGASGHAGVEVAALEGQSFDDVTAAPSDGFESDREDGPEDSNTDPDNPFNNSVQSWFDYNLMTHELKPHDMTYVVHSSEGNYFKLHFENYYDKAGSPANVTFHWAEISAPD